MRRRELLVNQSMSKQTMEDITSGNTLPYISPLNYVIIILKTLGIYIAWVCYLCKQRHS